MHGAGGYLPKRRATRRLVHACSLGFLCGRDDARHHDKQQHHHHHLHDDEHEHGHGLAFGQPRRSWWAGSRELLAVSLVRLPCLSTHHSRPQRQAPRRARQPPPPRAGAQPLPAPPTLDETQVSTSVCALPLSPSLPPASPFNPTIQVSPPTSLLFLPRTVVCCCCCCCGFGND